MISNNYKGVLGDMAKAGIGGTMAYKFLANKVGENQNLGFILHDCQKKNLQTKRSNHISEGDYESLLNHLNCMQMQNLMFFFYAVLVSMIQDIKKPSHHRNSYSQI